MEFERLVALHKDSVYRQLIRTCGNREDAEDALVESLVAAWQASDRLQHPDAFRSWVGTIARRVCGHIRRNDKLKVVLDGEGLDEFVGDIEGGQKKAEMEQIKGCISFAVESLDEEYREVYVRRELKGQSTQKVAEELGMTDAAVKSRLHRAREKVRENLDGSVCVGMNP